MRNIVLITVLLLSVITVVGQQSTSLSDERFNANQLPRLRQVVTADFTDVPYRWGSETVYFRTGNNIPIPLSDSPSMQLGLDTALSTRGMKDATINRGFVMRLDILTKYGDRLATKDSIVETRVSGHASGFKDRALLIIEPRTVELKVLMPIQVGTGKNGERVFLKPGTWLLRFHCTIQSLESENFHWYARDDSESLMVQGRTFGTSGSNYATADPYADLQYINPYGALAYSFSRVGKLALLLFHRPNIDLPVNTQIFFRMDRVEATFLTEPLPSDTPVPIKEKTKINK